MVGRIYLSLAPVLLLALGGCATLPEPTKATSWLKRLRTPGLDANVVQIDVALIERPVGDNFLNNELWTHTDEMIVDIERKGLVEDNGYRVGQVVGGTPIGLQTLLHSERACVNPRRRLVPAGLPVTQVLSGNLATASVHVFQGKQKQEISVDRARFCLEVVPTLTTDGRTKLCIAPKLETGETMLPFQPDPDKSTWSLRVERPAKTFKNVSWDVTLAPGEFLVIGARLDRPNTLGHRSFVVDDLSNPMQRLLVIRTTRSITGGDTGEPTLEDLSRASRSPCLAVQAGMTAARGPGN